MKALIVGGDSTIGKELARELPKVGASVTATSRRPPPFVPYLDLAQPIPQLPACDIAFLCAGIRSFKDCERDPMSWRVNVDGILAVGKQLMRAGAFVVNISTDAVEWSNSALARQKAHAELGLQAFGDPAIVRCTRFDHATAPRAAAFMIEVAMARAPGIFHWSATADAKRMAWEPKAYIEGLGVQDLTIGEVRRMSKAV